MILAQVLQRSQKSILLGFKSFLTIFKFSKERMKVENSGLNFTNILKTAFMGLDPKRSKNTVKPSVFFVLLGSGQVKTWGKMLVKLIPDNVLNINLDRSKGMRRSFCKI